VKTNFVNTEDIKKVMESGKRFNYKFELPLLKGYANLKDKNININLEYVGWKFMTEDTIIEEMSKTITHEAVHILIDEHNNGKMSYEVEEQICRLMADQDIMMFEDVEYIDAQ